MGLSSRGTAIQIPIPHEPGEWMAFRRLSAYELDERTAKGGDLCTDGWADLTMKQRFDLCHRWLSACGAGWSYAEPFTEESRRELDAPTLLWVYQTLVPFNYHSETPEEKKPDLPASTTG